jgi:hypothetical protein
MTADVKSRSFFRRSVWFRCWMVSAASEFDRSSSERSEGEGSPVSFE